MQSFNFNTLHEIIINFEKAIPKNLQAQKAKLMIYLRTGNEQQSTEFNTKIRIIDNDDEFVHWSCAYFYPQNAVS